MAEEIALALDVVKLVIRSAIVPRAGLEAAWLATAVVKPVIRSATVPRAAREVVRPASTAAELGEFTSAVLNATNYIY